MKHSKLTALIFIALILGVLVGHFTPDFAVKMRPFAEIFLRMVKMIIAPLLFATLVVGISGHDDAKSLGKIGLKTIIYFEIVTTELGLIFQELDCAIKNLKKWAKTERVSTPTGPPL